MPYCKLATQTTMDDSDNLARHEAIELAPGFDKVAFLYWRSPRAADANPARMDNQVWTWLVRTRHSAYRADELMLGGDKAHGPGWSFDRFGQSRTRLPGGATLLIGGEHEDWYDPDFYIYNDAVVLGPGGEVAIYGYPEAVFPPTDFHSATLAGETVILIGSLGYQDRRKFGRTQVVALSLATMEMQAMPTAGEGPGWISRHQAALSDDGASIVLSGGEVLRAGGSDARENLDTWRLDLLTWAWSCAERRDWQRCTLAPVARQRNVLWELGRALFAREMGWLDELRLSIDALTPALGQDPDLDLYAGRYLMDGAARAVDGADADRGDTFRVSLDGIEVRFTESQFKVAVVVEGRLAPERFEALVASVIDKLARLHHCEWEQAED